MRRIAHVTDLHIRDFLADCYGIDTERNVLAVLHSIKDRGIPEVALTGDLGEPEWYPWLFDTIRDFGFDLRVIPGNHDVPKELRKFPFLEPSFKKDGLYYAEAIDGTDYLFMDSGSEKIGRAQLAWLKRELGSSRRPVALFVHHPILDCGGTVMDRLYPLKNRGFVRDLLLASGRETTIFCGHYHNRYETMEGSLRQFVTPSTLIQFKGNGEGLEVDHRRIAYREITMGTGLPETRLIDVQVAP